MYSLLITRFCIVYVSFVWFLYDTDRDMTRIFKNIWIFVDFRHGVHYIWLVLDYFDIVRYTGYRISGELILRLRGSEDGRCCVSKYMEYGARFVVTFSRGLRKA